MSLNRYATRRDANERDLVLAARKLGWWMLRLNSPCDFLGYHRNRGWTPIEVKTKKGEYTEAQKTFIASAGILEAPFLTWRTISDVEKDSQ